jgi:hypothetical protein
VERHQVAEDVVLRASAGRGPDDDATVEPGFVAELADNAAQPASLFARFDLARHADVVHGRHEDEEAARHRDVGREAGALGAERLLHDLDDDFLTLAKQFFDLRLRPIPIAARIGSTRSRAGPAFAARAAARRRPSRRPRHRACRTPPG